ncbi:MAG: DUF4390 domain-containing protein [Candidatus Cloacimonetes bacterium]|nr:DUF4390 domain-containing protein [Candidatus Cloacimonadota bacterium]
MFQSLTQKVISGVVALSMMLLSGYQGNDAEFSEIEAVFQEKGVLIRTRLISAFENDFEELFKSGQEISVFFELNLKEKKEVFFRQIFRHSLQFDPLEQSFHVVIEESGYDLIVNSYENLLEAISIFEYFYKDELPDKFEIKLWAYLENIRIESINEEYDMMMLWKFKKPLISKKFVRSEYEI